MKRPRKLTRNQKIMLSQLGYDPAQYLLVQDLPNQLFLQERKTALKVVVDKPTGGG